MEQSITIHLAKGEIDAVFEKRNRERWGKYLDVYDYLRRELENAHALPDYERRFNYFYQVRRNADWRRKFYALFYDLRSEGRNKEKDFAYILQVLFKETGKVEASFASKLLAMLDPALPIIDRHVLSYIGEKLPPAHYDPAKRMEVIAVLYRNMENGFNTYLGTEAGEHLLARFRQEYPTRTVSDMKMLDFVLWQSGGKKGLPIKKRLSR